jgi:signal transduction histidine kinase
VAPLAIFVGLVVAIAPPLTYRLVAGAQLAEQAEIYAGNVAHRLREAIFQQPDLWRYNADKILQTTMVYSRQKDIASIEIHDCEGNTVLSSNTAGIGTGSRKGPRRSVAVEALGALAAVVTVQLDVSSHYFAVKLISAISLLLGLGMGLLIYFYPTRVVRRQSRELSQANRELGSARDELAAINRDLERRVQESVGNVRALSARVVQIQEEERARIARDLHDGIGQAITGLQMELELAQSRPDQAEKYLARSIETCAETLGELRRVVQEIRPPELDAGDVSEPLRAYAELFEKRTGLATYFQANTAVECSRDAALCLLRVLQEALTNVKRHANASEVAIRLSSSEDQVVMEVTDDGSGFSPTTTVRGHGLRGMRERCEFAGGSLEVESSVGEGTCLRARLPREEHSA